MSDYQQLPSNLPVPQDDGAADHLPGAAMPPLHPIFPPDGHAAEVLEWLRGHATAGTSA